MDKAAILALFNDNIEEHRKAIKEFVMDTSNSYEDRLEIWKTCPDHIAPTEPWVLHLRKFDKKYGEISWYDDFYVERYSVFELNAVLDMKEGNWPDEKIKDFVDECMDLGYFKFKMDW